MQTPGKSVQDKLEDLKTKVKSFADYFKENFKRFNDYKEFVFVDSLTQDDIDSLNEYDKPTLRFNILEAFISRLRGEFAVLNPQIDLKPKDSNVPSSLIDVITNIIRGILYQSESDNVDNEVYKDILGGGFCILKIYTEYANENSYDQVIKIGNVFDPTLCGFDPYARSPHKGDGKYCFELIPLKEDEFKDLYPQVNIETLNFTNPTQYGLTWAFKTDTQEKVIYVCDFYLKNQKRVMKHLLSNGQVVTNEEYSNIEQSILESTEPMVSPKKIKSEMRTVTKIVRYRFIETTVLEYVETDYDHLPLIFFDGNSVTINNKQVTRPYIYNAKDAQRAKNVSANSFFDEITNLRRTTIMTPIRALPDKPEFLMPYLEPQKAYSSYVYNDMDDNGSPVNSPQVFPRTPIPPELFQAFSTLDQTIQTILGSYDAQIGIQNNNISGKAIIAAATQSNAAAKPYIVNYIASMNQVAKILLHMIPKFYTTPRTIPVIDKLGKRHYQVINDPSNPQSVSMVYDPNIFDLYVEEGASFENQKKQSLELLNQMAQSNQGIGQLLSQPQGINILLDNLDINGADQLKELNEKMQQKQQQQQQQIQQQQQNMPPLPNPEMISIQMKQQEMQQIAQKNQLDAQIKMTELQLKKDAQNLDKIKSQHQIMMDYLQLASERERAQAEVQKAQDEVDKSAAELRLKQVNQAFDHYSFLVNKFHDLSKEEKYE